VAVKAVHSQNFEKNVHHQWIVGGHDQLNVAGMTRALETFVSAGCAHGIPLVGGDSEERIIEASLNGFLLCIINLRFFDLADAESPQFFWENEAKLNL
jgi:hypothetical protein